MFMYRSPDCAAARVYSSDGMWNVVLPPVPWSVLIDPSHVMMAASRDLRVFFCLPAAADDFSLFHLKKAFFETGVPCR